MERFTVRVPYGSRDYKDLVEKSLQELWRMSVIAYEFWSNHIFDTLNEARQPYLLNRIDLPEDRAQWFTATQRNALCKYLENKAHLSPTGIFYGDTLEVQAAARVYGDLLTMNVAQYSKYNVVIADATLPPQMPLALLPYRARRPFFSEDNKWSGIMLWLKGNHYQALLTRNSPASIRLLQQDEFEHEFKLQPLRL